MAVDQHAAELAAWLYDEQKVVTCRWLSLVLNIPAASSRRLLADFQTLNKDKVRAIYLISGLKQEEEKPQGDSPAEEGQGGGNSNSRQDLKQERRDVVLVPQEDLPKAKKDHFSRVQSVQIYSLQAVPSSDPDGAASAAKALQLLTNEMSLARELADATTESGESFRLNRLGAVSCAQVKLSAKGHAPPPLPRSSDTSVGFGGPIACSAPCLSSNGSGRSPAASKPKGKKMSVGDFFAKRPSTTNNKGEASSKAKETKKADEEEEKKKPAAEKSPKEKAPPVAEEGKKNKQVVVEEEEASEVDEEEMEDTSSAKVRDEDVVKEKKADAEGSAAAAGKDDDGDDDDEDNSDEEEWEPQARTAEQKKKDKEDKVAYKAQLKAEAEAAKEAKKVARQQKKMQPKKRKSKEAASESDDDDGDSDEEDGTKKKKGKGRKRKSAKGEGEEVQDDVVIEPVSGAMDAFVKPVSEQPQTGGPRKTKQLVEKSYLDADGFLVVESVWEEVEVNEPPPKPAPPPSSSASSSFGANNSNTAAAQAKKRKAEESGGGSKKGGGKETSGKTVQKSVLSFFKRAS